MKRFLLMVLLLGALVGCSRSEGPVIVSTPPPSATITPSTAPAAAPTEAPATATLEHYPPPPQPAATSAALKPYPAPTQPAPTPGYPLAQPTAAQPTAYPGPLATPPAASLDLDKVELGLELVVDGLASPVAVAHAGDGSDRLFVVEKAGVIRIVSNGNLVPDPFIDITDRVEAGGSEQGLLGLAFHPDFQTNGWFFVNYTGNGGTTIISRFQAGEQRLTADPASEENVLTQPQPAANHNGGHLAFGPDGYLYIGLGDGGAAGDQFGNGQNGATWLGAMLRIDVDQLPYTIPADNPFVGDAAVVDEIWAIGLRNPWRYAFDRLTGDLYIADVGQGQYEEVDLQTAGSPGGENYGWPIMEGGHCYPPGAGNCDQSGLTLPVIEYDHSQGCSITGGYVYRGPDSPAAHGLYLFGDYCSGRIWGLVSIPGRDPGVAELTRVDLRLSSFGEDEAGELYLVAIDKGELYHIVLR
jgi:glucose/arabinose dehydrogenase